MNKVSDTQEKPTLAEIFQDENTRFFIAKLPEWNGFWFKANEKVYVFTKDNELCFFWKECDSFLVVVRVPQSHMELGYLEVVAATNVKGYHVGLLDSLPVNRANFLAVGFEK